jgi:GT2 family glycosyltransferase
MTVGQRTRVSLVILNWNSYRATIACLESVFLMVKGEIKLDIYLVDNGSEDNSVDKLANHLIGCGLSLAGSSFKDGLKYQTFMENSTDSSKKTNTGLGEIYLIEAGVNGGYAKGNNIGLRFAQRLSYDYYWILNNDTQVERACLKQLIEKAREDDRETGLWGVKLMQLNNPDELECFGGYQISLITMRGHPTRDLSHFRRLQDNKNSCGSFYISGASMMLSSHLLDHIKSLSEDYFLYCEEVDLASRMGAFKMSVADKAVVFHVGGGSAKTANGKGGFGSAQSEYRMARSKVIYSLKYNKKFITSVITFQFLRGLKSILFGHGISLFKAIVLGIKSGFLFRSEL